MNAKNKTLIVFATRHGCTEKCATTLKSKLKGMIELRNLKNSAASNLDEYETIIIGGSIHAGRIQRKVARFCATNLDTLLKKKIGLYLCCMEEAEKAGEQFNNAYPQELIAHATATGIFGGEFNLESMNRLDRFIVKKVAKVDKSISKLSEESISKFIAEMS